MPPRLTRNPSTPHPCPFRQFRQTMLRRPTGCACSGARLSRIGPTEARTANPSTSSAASTGGKGTGRSLRTSCPHAGLKARDGHPNTGLRLARSTTSIILSPTRARRSLLSKARRRQTRRRASSPGQSSRHQAAARRRRVRPIGIRSAVGLSCFVRTMMRRGGRQYAQEVAASALKLGCSVSIVDTAALREKVANDVPADNGWDIADAVIACSDIAALRKAIASVTKPVDPPKAYVSVFPFT